MDLDSPSKYRLMGTPLFGRQFLRDFKAKVLKDSGFLRKIPIPVRLIDPFCTQLPRHMIRSSRSFRRRSMAEFDAVKYPNNWLTRVAPVILDGA
jgi:hypothetical protein